MDHKSLLLSAVCCLGVSSVLGWSMFDMHEKSKFYWLPLSVIAWMASIYSLIGTQNALLHYYIKQNRQPHVDKTLPVTEAEMKNFKGDILPIISKYAILSGCILFICGTGSFSKGLISTLVAKFVVEQLRYSQ